MTDNIQKVGRVDRQQHTPEPWKIDNKLGTRIYSTKEDANHEQLIAILSPLECSPGKATCNANTARIVACVNAMAGIEDPETWMKTTKEVMEGNLKLQASWSNVIEQLRQDREELLSALKNERYNMLKRGVTVDNADSFHALNVLITKHDR